MANSYPGRTFTTYSITSLPGVLSDLLTDRTAQPDTLVADLWKELHFGQLIQRAGFKKRTGLPIEQVIYLLMIWIWVQAATIVMISTVSCALESIILRVPQTHKIQIRNTDNIDPSISLGNY